jgi:predicted phosphodiesterase
MRGGRRSPDGDHRATTDRRNLRPETPARYRAEETAAMIESAARIRTIGPVLLFGGPYGNLEATEALLAAAARRGIAPDHIVCTGDLTAYCADPEAVVDRIRAAGLHVVMGNCEESLAAAADDCGCGFAEDSTCAALSAAWYAYTDRRLDGATRDWFATLPRALAVTVGGAMLRVVHGGVDRINRFVFASDTAAIAAALAAVPEDGVIAGHCGLPFTRVAGGRLWHNPGVIGLPANDGTPRVWYSVLTPIAGGLRIEPSPLGYDHARAAARMRDARLSAGYADALETGRWPSFDVLPAAERARAGIALAPRALAWRPAATRAGAA